MNKTVGVLLGTALLVTSSMPSNAQKRTGRKISGKPEISAKVRGKFQARELGSRKLPSTTNTSSAVLDLQTLKNEHAFLLTEKDLKKNILQETRRAAFANQKLRQLSDPLNNTTGWVSPQVVDQLVEWNVINPDKPLINMHGNRMAKEVIDENLALLAKKDFIGKFYQKDPSAWKQDAESQEFISQFLGWTDVYNWTLLNLDKVEKVALDAKQNFDHAVVMGMGGSSLAPEVFRQVFGQQEGWPELIVLDTTNPDQIRDVTNHINLKRTLFIYASKSGGTVEPASQYAYFSGLLKEQGVKDPAKNFIAITDEGTGLEALAKKDGFREIFLNPADVGGRFSALSMFGIVPAAVMGVDVQRLLLTAKNNAALFGPAIPAESNVALNLGALMGGRLNGKMVLWFPKQLESFGLWVEQLVAESLGKEGTGVVPVAGAKVQLAKQASPDQFYVRIDMHTANDGIMAKAESNQANMQLNSQHPVFTMDMKDPYQLGAMMLTWEVATSVAGARLQINPFDQPNVQAAKTMTKNLLAELKAGRVPEGIDTPLLVSRPLQGQMDPADFSGEAFYNLLNPGDYVGILAYLNPTPEIDAALSDLRQTITNHVSADVHEDKTKTVTFGYGPRYLHSTGQLHKGGRNQGIYLILSAKPEQDVKIPGQDYTFGQLTNSQALGDFQALEQNGRRAIRIYWDGSTPIVDAIKNLTKELK